MSKQLTKKGVICKQRWIVSSPLKVTEEKIKELEDGLDFANTEHESFKEKFDKLKSESDQLRDEKLYTEVY